MNGLEDMMANIVLVNAKNDSSSRTKHIKKLILPGGHVCEKSHKLLNEELERSLNPAFKDQKEERLKHEYHQICQTQAIGKKLFGEFCNQATTEIRDAYNFVQDIHDYEIAADGERIKKIDGIASTYFALNSKRVLGFIASNVRELLANSCWKNGEIPQYSEITDVLNVLVQKEGVSSEYHVKEEQISEDDREYLLSLIKIMLIKCKEKANNYLSKNALPGYRKSDLFKTFLKWKHLEQEPVNEDLFLPYRLLGRGGFGEVYAYQVKISGKMYACKKIHKKRMKQKHAEKTVLIEKVVLEKVNSRFVVSLAYAYESKESLNLMITLMGGGDLKFHIYERDKKNRGVSESQCKMYAAQIILGLTHLHEENILYRDMKPENVLLDDTGNCRIADLGLAHILKDGEMIKGKAGTVGFMAPEMLKSESYSYGVDWFALGCTIYEMCEGRGAFVVSEKVNGKKKMNQEKTIKKTIEDPIDFKRNHDPALKDILCQLLVKNMNDRLAGNGGNHAYFADLNWERLSAGLIPPPFIPNSNEIYAKDVSDIRLPSDAKGVQITEKDKEFYREFATGRIPASWQEEILESGVYDVLMSRSSAESQTTFKQSKMCTII